jgi:hypothetical protein
MKTSVRRLPAWKLSRDRLPETSYDEDLLTSTTVLFLQPARANRAKRALRIALGAEKFELLIGFLTFIRSAHYWTLMHPELAFEDDIKGAAAPP